jgi:hypothetical protein
MAGQWKRVEPQLEKKHSKELHKQIDRNTHCDWLSVKYVGFQKDQPF